MADSNFRGPVVSMGALENLANATSSQLFANATTPIITDVQALDGMAMSYQGFGFLDPRFVPYNKDNFRSAQVPFFYNNNDVVVMDNVPQAAGTALLAASQAATAAVAISLATTQVQNLIAGQCFIAPVAIVPIGTTVAQNVLAIDFGFATGTTVANSSTITVNDNTQFEFGQWIVVGGAGNAAGQASLYTQVQTISSTNSTGITVLPVPATAITNAPIGQANLFGAQFLPPGTAYGPQTATAFAAQNGLDVGLGRAWNPREGLARNVSVSAGTTTATTALTVTGYDVYRNLMTEKITIPSGNRSSSTFFGSKAFKYIQSVAVQTTAGGSLGLGLGDVFGCGFRADTWSQFQVVWNGCAPQTSLGFTAAVTTAPATNTTGDVRGTIQISTNGTGTAMTIATAAVTNGTARLTVTQSLGLWNASFATPNNLVPLFGVPQSTT